LQQKGSLRTNDLNQFHNISSIGIATLTSLKLILSAAVKLRARGDGYGGFSCDIALVTGIKEDRYYYGFV
jgi:hypothetical protein